MRDAPCTRLLFLVCLQESAFGYSFGRKEGAFKLLSVGGKSQPAAADFPRCTFKEGPMEDPMDLQLPHLVDVFADQDAKRIFFISVNHQVCGQPVTQYLPDGENFRAVPWRGLSFTCDFSLSASGSEDTTGTGTKYRTSSDQINGDEDVVIAHW